jgi:aminoglycoside phosphotransferase (APT) family kinase protein
MRRGWWTEASDWVDERLAEVGQRRIGDLEPKEHWGVSAVARVPTSGGSMWLKSVPPFFAREPAVLRLLAERLPGRVPPVVAADETAVETRLLLADAGHVPDEVAARDRPRLAALLADLQVRSLDLLPRLAAAGCADHSPAQLAVELARMVEEGVELDLLDTQERAQLRRLVPELTDQLLALSGGPLPTVLVHGDFHPWNVARAPGWAASDAVIIDWTDAGIGPAGVDLTTLLPETAGEAARREVRRAYAEVFATHLGISLSVADAAVGATAVAAHVIQALAYDVILRGVEPAAAWSLSGVMAARLRALLARD